MNELALKYGCNPNQKPSRIYMEDGSDLPVTVLNGKPGYINFLDALNSIQLVKELKAACGLPAAASFKHVSPAGAALGLPLTDVERRMCSAMSLLTARTSKMHMDSKACVPTNWFQHCVSPPLMSA